MTALLLYKELPALVSNMPIWPAVLGRAKESHARSCHQEVVRQSKASLALAEASSGDTSCSTDNGYLAVARVAVALKLPGVADQALKLAAGE
jgi:hypothetical protein